MPITPLPPAPTPDDSVAVFNAKAGAFVPALATMVVEANALQANVNAKEVSVNAAAAAAIAAAAATGVTGSIWVSGTVYAVGDVRWSPANFQTYRRVTAGVGTTDPSLDAANWTAITASLPDFVLLAQGVV